MRIREKTATDFEELESVSGVRFFHDAGRTAIASSIQTHEAEILAARNPMRKWAYTHLIRLLAEGESDSEEITDIQKRMRLVNNLESYIVNYESGMSGSRLSHRQHDVFHNISQFLRGEMQSNSQGMTQAGYIEMPTGAGKTVIFSELLKALHGNEPSSLKSLVLVPRKEILAQAVGQKQTGQGLATFAPELSVTSYSSESKDLKGDVTVMTYASFNRALKTGVIDENFCDVMICDEAHRALGDVTKSNVLEFSKNKIAIGLTATSAFGENKRVDELFPVNIHSADLRETIEQGTLAPVQAWLYKTGASIDTDTTHSDYTPHELAKIANLSERNIRAVDFAKGFIEEGLQGIISCLPGENLWHAKHIADLINSSKVIDHRTGNERMARANIVSGTMPIDQRAQIYTAFERGEIDALTFVDVINEGWDSQAAKFLINLRPTCSPVLGTQRLGRILRPNTSIESTAQVVDFVDETKKAQFIALHALGEYRYNLGTVIGGGSSNGGIDYRKINIPDELRDSITNVNHTAVKNIIVGRKYETTRINDVSLEKLSQELDADPQVVLFVARDLGIQLLYGGKGTADVKAIFINDKHRETLQEALHSNSYNYIATLEPDIIHLLIDEQSKKLADTLNKADKQMQAPSALYFEGMSSGTIVKTLLQGQVTYADLPTEARELLLNEELSIRQITDLLITLKGYDNESLRRALFIKIGSIPDGAGLVLSCAKSVGHISDFRQTTLEKGNTFTSNLVIDRKNGEQINVSASDTKNKKVARHVARFDALTALTGLTEISHAIEVDRESLQHRKTAVQILNEYAASTYGEQRPVFTVEHIINKGKNATFHATAVLEKEWQTYEGSGTGNSRKAAEHAAAEQIIIDPSIQKWLHAQSRIKKPTYMDKERPKTSSPERPRLFNKLHPNVVLVHFEQTGKINDLEYNDTAFPESGQGMMKYTINFKDARTDTLYTIEGPIRNGRKAAKLAASKLALEHEQVIAYATSN